jgi:hypothetical protein
MPPRKLRPFTAAGPRDISGKPLVEVPAPPEIKQHLFCKSRFSEVGHLASMFR